ncbi:hypothetical protein AAFC00_003403 [Neodothiora populina]
MAMMEGLEEAAGLASPSAQLRAAFDHANGTTTNNNNNNNNNTFFASSASHTVFPSTYTVGQQPSKGNSLHNHEHGDNVHSSDIRSRSPSHQRIHSQTPSQGQSRPPDTHDLTDAELEDMILHPWAESSRIEFHQKFNTSNPTYKNKLRLNPAAEARVRFFLLHPNSPIDPNSPADARLKARSRSYTLHPWTPHGHLYRADNGPTLRRHVSETEVWGLLTDEHVRSGHKGRDRMLSIIKERYVGYTLEELMFVLSTCRVCQRARTGSNSGPGAAEISQRLRASLGSMHLSPSEPLSNDVSLRPPIMADVQTLQRGVGDQSMATPSATLTGAMHAPTAPMDGTRQPLLPQGQYNAHLGIIRPTHVPDGAEMRKSKYAPDEKGLVMYDVPDWYC